MVDRLEEKSESGWFCDNCGDCSPGVIPEDCIVCGSGEIIETEGQWRERELSPTEISIGWSPDLTKYNRKLRDESRIRRAERVRAKKRERRVVAIVTCSLADARFPVQKARTFDLNASLGLVLLWAENVANEKGTDHYKVELVLESD